MLLLCIIDIIIDMKRLLRKYFHGISTPDEFKEFSIGMLDKQNEDFLLGEMDILWEEILIDSADFPVPNLGVFQKIKNSILIDKLNKSYKKVRSYSIILKIAAVLAVSLIIYDFIYFKNSDQDKKKKQFQTINTPFGAKTSTVLPDGSLVWLNAGSSITFPLMFDENRRVILQGEAYFEVIKSAKLFVVSTIYGDVEVLGTSFNVKAFSDYPSFETTLVKGSVLIKGKNTKVKFALKPGQMTFYENKRFYIKNVDAVLFTRWKDGKLVFRKEYLTEVARKLERWYNVKIELEKDDRLKEIWFSGVLEMETFPEVLELLEATAPISYFFNNKTRVTKISYRKKNSNL